MLKGHRAIFCSSFLKLQPKSRACDWQVGKKSHLEATLFDDIGVLFVKQV